MKIDLKHDAKVTKGHKLARKMEVSAGLSPQGNGHPKFDIVSPFSLFSSCGANLSPVYSAPSATVGGKSDP